MPDSRFRGVRRLLAVALPALATALPAPAATMRAFVTSTTCNGDLGPCSAAVGDIGLAAANNICQERAVAGGLVTGAEVFRAWASDTTADAYCNVLGLAGQRFGSPACGVGTVPPGGPWTRLDGVPFVASLDQLLSPGAISSITIDEFGATTLSFPFFQSGTDSSGTLRATHYCNGWIDGTVNFNVSGGNTDVVGPGWGSGASTNCSAPKRLVCLEVGAGDPLVYPSAAGALAFVTSTTGTGDLDTWAGSGGADGLAGADAVCRALATAAGLPLPASFVAFLSDGSTDASSRLTIDGPWERVDGVKIADSLADLTDGTLDDPLAIDELDGRFGVDAWTGTLENGTSTGSNCAGWTSGLGADSGSLGRPWRCVNDWTGGNTFSCDEPFHLFCFSNQLLLGWDHFESGDLRRWPEKMGQP